MNLSDLGWDGFFSAHARSLAQDGQTIARVMAVDRDRFVIRGVEGERVAQLSGKFRFEHESGPELPCVGDWVCVDAASLPLVQAILPRRSFLRRKVPAKRVEHQMIACNLDVAFIMQSCHFDFNLRRLDRYLIAAREGGVEPVILLSKTDRVSPDELAGLRSSIRDAGINIPILSFSNLSGEGLDELRGLLIPGRTFCLLGSSGVGKSTLINRLLG